MLPLLPHTFVVCLLIIIQSLILFILQILIRSLLVLEDGELAGRLKLWYIMPLNTASLCCWFVFNHSLSRCQLAGGRASLPTLGLLLCLAQNAVDKGSPYSPD